MSKQSKATKRYPGGAAMLAAAAVVVMFAAGCDSRVDVKGPRFTLPTVPALPTVPSAATITEPRAIAGVYAVTLQAVGHVRIALGGAESLTISAPENVMPLLTSEVSAGRLILGRDSGSYEGQASDIQYEISLQQLDELALEGVGAILAERVETSLFSARVNGVGEIRASGRADRQEVQVAGVGGYIAPTLESRVTHVNISAGNAVVWATERLEGWVGFGCTLEYWGDPEVSIQGRGTVRRIGLKS